MLKEELKAWPSFVTVWRLAGLLLLGWLLALWYFGEGIFWYFSLAAAALLPLMLAVYYARTEGAKSRQLKKVTEQLAGSRIFLKNIINYVPDPIFVKDRQHRWIEGNTAMWALFGKREEDLIGKSDYDFFPKEEADVFWRKDDEVFTSGQTNINIENFTDASGVTHIISTKKACFTGSAGEQILVGVIRDITELRRMEEKLKESDEARFNAIMNHVGRPVYIKDLEGRYTLVNKKFLELFARDGRSIIGKTDAELFAKEYAEKYRLNDLEVIEKAAALEFEETVAGKDGQHTYVSVKFPLYDANDKIYAICGISSDITERKKYEEKLKNAMEKLAKANSEMESFTYIASHDLRAPLVNLQGFAHELDSAIKLITPAALQGASAFPPEQKAAIDGVLNDDIPEALGFIRSSVHRMDMLTNAILELSRIGRRELNFEKINTEKLLKECLDVLQHKIRSQKITVNIGPLPEITADYVAVQQVFGNIIDNAIKYMRPDEAGEINISGRQENTEVVFEIADNGRGIDERDIGKIFEIFRRIGDNTGIEGEGMGMAYVKAILTRHNGHIWCQSTPGKGTTFFFTIAHNLSGNDA